MKLFLITVNYNSSAKALQLLESLRVQIDNDFEIFVVDNGSAPEDVKALENGLVGLPPSFHLIKNKENLGFSGGNNIGIKAALDQKADWVILINIDTTVGKDFISPLKKYLANTPAKIVGIPLQEGQRTAYAGIVSWLTPTMRHAYSLAETRGVRTYAIGGGMAMHRELLERVGLWDERYFLYFEDVDFSECVRKAGYNIAIAEDLRINHEVSGTTRALGAPLLLRYHARNALLFNSQHAPWYAKIALLPLSLFGILVQIIKLVIRPTERPQAQAIMDGILDFWRGRFGKISTQ